MWWGKLWTIHSYFLCHVSSILLGQVLFGLSASWMCSWRLIFSFWWMNTIDDLWTMIKSDVSASTPTNLNEKFQFWPEELRSNYTHDCMGQMETPKGDKIQLYPHYCYYFIIAVKLYLFSTFTIKHTAQCYRNLNRFWFIPNDQERSSNGKEKFYFSFPLLLIWLTILAPDNPWHSNSRSTHSPMWKRATDLSAGGWDSFPVLPRLSLLQWWP